jgi:hypothetical protein
MDADSEELELTPPPATPPARKKRPVSSDDRQHVTSASSIRDSQR